jgi:hypothetical protein
LSVCAGCLIAGLALRIAWSPASPVRERAAAGSRYDSPTARPERARVEEAPAPRKTRAREVAPGTPRQPGNDPSDRLFSPGIVPRIAITIDPAGWRSLERSPRDYVEATVEADGETFERVGIHLKGAAGSFRPISSNPALTLKFNEFVPRQKFHGLRKLHLNNSVQDRTYLHEIIASELFLAAGVPAARATQARVTLNGRDLGIYVLKEGFDRRFLRRYFRDDSGNLYDGGFCQDIHAPLENDTHRDSRDRSDLLALRRAAQTPDLEDRWRRLGEVLDVERFFSFLALEVLLWDWDGYPMKPNNYRIYHDPESDRLVFFPHGTDQLFARPDGPIMPHMAGLVARAVMETPRGRAKYLERLREILDTVFLPGAIDRRIVEVRDRLVPLARGRGRDASLVQRIESLRASVRERARSVERQLHQRPARPLVPDGSGLATLERQRWYTEKDTGGVEASEVEGPGGEVLLMVDSHGNRCFGSWRSRVLLARGAYSLRGRVRTEGVVPIADRKGTGAGLRLGDSETPRRNQAIGDSGWRMLEQHFEIHSSHEEVEIVCELRATEGRAWFDRASLAIVRRGPSEEAR